MTRFSEYRFSGSAQAIGEQHGEALRDRIADALAFYRRIFALPEPDLLQLGASFADRIQRFRPDYHMEIASIARAAGQDERLLFALNSRSELFNNCTVAECTAVYSQRERILAQNWDWAEELERLVADVTIERPDGHRIRMLTEPGIIGKIGLNSAGLGTCLNILVSQQPLHGVPVHIMLRAILDCRSLDEVQQLLERHGAGKASHVLTGSADGRAISTEFTAAGPLYLQPRDGLLVHSNHYLADESLNFTDSFPFTRQRLQRARKMLAEDASRDGIRRMLLDRSAEEQSICRPYSPTDLPRFGQVGTIFSVIMDLEAQTISVRPGSAGSDDFYSVTV